MIKVINLINRAILIGKVRWINIDPYATKLHNLHKNHLKTFAPSDIFHEKIDVELPRFTRRQDFTSGAK